MTSGPNLEPSKMAPLTWRTGGSFILAGDTLPIATLCHHIEQTRVLEIKHFFQHTYVRFVINLLRNLKPPSETIRKLGLAIFEIIYSQKV